MAEMTANASPMGSEKSSWLRTLLWGGFGFTLFLIFTLAKLPDERIKPYIQNTISAALAPQGITFQAESGELSLKMGGSYVLHHVTLGFPNSVTPVKIDSIAVSPSFASLLRGALGANVDVEIGSGSLQGSFSSKADTVSLDLNLSSLDVGKLGVLGLAAGLKGSLILDGKVALNGAFNNPSTLSGDIGVDIKGLTLDQQTLMGFNIPKLTVSTGKIDAGIDKGKVTIRAVKLGKPASLDDIQAVVTGDITLQRVIENSSMSLKTRFTLSQTILKSFILIDALLGPGKQRDGSYAFTLGGTFSAPTSAPGN